MSEKLQGEKGVVKGNTSCAWVQYTCRLRGGEATTVEGAPYGASFFLAQHISDHVAYASASESVLVCI